MWRIVSLCREGVILNLQTGGRFCVGVMLVTYGNLLSLNYSHSKCLSLTWSVDLV